ncbi:hypothetical protein [Microbacterium suwonense]|uniref:D-methionine transport system permease protein MetI n=1 Tax=Microbacterium suwonense TaxID=683047 RepID=A0ABM8FVU2_9MICO|nr:hypothetical protein [Microbacterium suwonense]BDZ39641.1 hypothetical protein GCM10025863_22550 [Microbacterium suwonense]
MTWLTDLLAEYGPDIVKSMAETGYMMLVSLLAAVLIGLPLGMTVYLTQRGGIAENRVVNLIADLYINVVRSFPFLLLVVFFIPFTRAVIGTSFGTPAATFPCASSRWRSMRGSPSRSCARSSPASRWSRGHWARRFRRRCSECCCPRRARGWSTR